MSDKPEVRIIHNETEMDESKAFSVEYKEDATAGVWKRIIGGAPLAEAKRYRTHLLKFTSIAEAMRRVWKEEVRVIPPPPKKKAKAKVD